MLTDIFTLIILKNDIFLFKIIVSCCPLLPYRCTLLFKIESDWIHFLFMSEPDGRHASWLGHLCLLPLYIEGCFGFFLIKRVCFCFIATSVWHFFSLYFAAVSVDKTSIILVYPLFSSEGIDSTEWQRTKLVLPYQRTGHWGACLTFSRLVVVLCDHLICHCHMTVTGPSELISPRGGVSSNHLPHVNRPLSVSVQFISSENWQFYSYNHRTN